MSRKRQQHWRNLAIVSMLSTLGGPTFAQAPAQPSRTNAPTTQESPDRQIRAGLKTTTLRKPTKLQQRQVEQFVDQNRSQIQSGRYSDPGC